ncbi:hypothetical protein BDP67DRAFT_518100 [Colletotrichum lupini]|nr:hypothetical protein BDP67DRAFT_518100 [Colletotrichum lupini]
MSSAGSSSEAATAPKSALTERELEILKHAWSSLKSAPEVRSTLTLKSSLSTSRIGQR